MTSPAERAASIDPGQLYEVVRQRLIATTRSLADDQLLTFVPAAPQWRVRDVLAHVVGLVTDLNAQHLPAADDVGGAAWGAAQVAVRHATPIGAMLSEWEREAPAFENGLRIFGYEEGSHFIGDLHAHHQDVRGALGLERDDDPTVVAVSLDHYLGFVHAILVDAHWGVLAVQASGEVRVLGTEAGSRRAQLAAPAFDVLRVFSARRSSAQIRRLRWRGDVDALVDLMAIGFSGGYALPLADVVE